MSFRPVSDKRKKELKEKIEATEKDLAVASGYLAQLRKELVEGEWYMGDAEHKRMIDQAKQAAKRA